MKKNGGNMKSGNTGKPAGAADPRLNKILGNYRRRANEIISVLQDIQEEYGYLPESVLRNVSREWGVSLVNIYGIATFYKLFRLQPAGRHTITVCAGTACHVRGAPRLVDEISRILGIAPGGTTKDGEYSMETVNCLGCCAIGPVLVRDGKYYGQVAPHTVKRLLEPAQVKEVVKP